MQRAAPTIKRSPRQAPGGAEVRPDTSAMATPVIATTTPSDLRVVSASLPSTLPTTIVNNGSVDKASAPRAAVVKIRDALNSSGNTAKNNTPKAATASQSRRAGQRTPCNSATGSSSTKPMPNRNEPM